MSRHSLVDGRLDRPAAFTRVRYPPGEFRQGWILDQSRSLPGSGLGLSLVKAVAELHGGALAFGDNAPGLVASLSLPAADAQ